VRSYGNLPQDPFRRSCLDCSPYKQPLLRRLAGTSITYDTSTAVVNCARRRTCSLSHAHAAVLLASRVSQSVQLASISRFTVTPRLAYAIALSLLLFATSAAAWDAVELAASAASRYVGNEFRACLVSGEPGEQHNQQQHYDSEQERHFGRPMVAKADLSEPTP
jgi:hypothetical protein